MFPVSAGTLIDTSLGDSIVNRSTAHIVSGCDAIRRTIGLERDVACDGCIVIGVRWAGVRLIELVPFRR
jgi:hypothetical protein